MINLVVALATESRPLIEHFGLCEDRSAVGFRLFRNESVGLVVTGVGRVSCAGGVAALGEKGGGDAAAWLNVGVAGHGTLDVGESVHAVSIEEVATGRRWYPPRVLDLPGHAAALRTVDVAEETYAEDFVYDMEASAFYASALRYATGELIQAYKIISDNRDNSVNKIDKHGIRNAIVDRLSEIEGMVDALSSLARDLLDVHPVIEEFDHMVERWRFTVTQQHELRGLLRKWKTLSGGESIWDAELNRCPSAKSVLAEIRMRLNAVYGGPVSGN